VLTSVAAAVAAAVATAAAQPTPATPGSAGRGSAARTGLVTEVVSRVPGDTVGNRYRAHLPAALPRGRARGPLVLLPGYGGDVDGYDPAGRDLPSTLPARLAARGVATVVAVPHPGTLYADAGALRRLDAIVAEARARYAVPGAPVAVGGFSAGGTGAVRFAERCAAGACGGTPPVAAAFAVDAPLDFARVWRQTDLTLRRGSPRANAAEGRLVLAALRGALRGALGGPPDAAAAAYRRASPLLASEVDGGNARWLRTTPLRAYTEPDVHWWMAGRAADYAGMNATDAAALVNVLRIGGNARAALVTTSGHQRPRGAPGRAAAPARVGDRGRARARGLARRTARPVRS
jgi:hypothetical protein